MPERRPGAGGFGAGPTAPAARTVPFASPSALEPSTRALGLDRRIEPPPTYGTDTVSLPKGGGALRSIAEKFAANPSTGTGSLSLPLAVTPARGLEPQLALSYDSGSGAGPFGLGWSLPMARIQRKTDKGLPGYCDDADTFVLSDAEDLVPRFVEESPGQWAIDTFTADDELSVTHTVLRYRPRIDAAFSRIERWTSQVDGTTHWRTRDRGNVLRLYGLSTESRVADPANPARVFAWLLCEVTDDRGNRMVVEYLEDDATALTSTAIYDNARRTGLSPFTQRYLRRVRYGNATPHAPRDSATDFLFAVAFDYGDMVDRTDTAAQAATHPVPDLDFAAVTPERPDPFSSRRSRFEIRTRFRCTRIALFHGVDDRLAPTVAAPLDTGEALAVRAWLLDYEADASPSRLASVTQVGFRTEGSAVSSLAVPPVSFGYQEPRLGATIEALSPGKDIEALPTGGSNSAFRWHDLDGEGLVGVLTELGGAWWYQRNLGDPSRWSASGARPQIGPLQSVRTLPNIGRFATGAVLADVDGDGRADLVVRQGTVAGSHKRKVGGWEPFRAFKKLPNIDWSDPALRFVDLTGDGRADLLLTEGSLFRVWPSVGEDGYGEERRVRYVQDERKAPQVVFGDRTQAVFLADMTGDGLSDLVRVRNNSVCYWPNLGYGDFGAQVILADAPMLDRPDAFDPARVRLADVAGSGTADLIYLGVREVKLFRNDGGNRLVAQGTIPFPPVHDPSTVDLVDLLGDGTQCLLNAPSLPSDPRKLFYVRLMAEGKPHLLTRIDNGQGGETRLSYAPSTQFYVNDRDRGVPWATTLPFPVSVLERIEVRDHLREHRIVQRFAYHHGFYDGVEREFRGFGMVEQWDTERFFDTDSADWFDETASGGDEFVAPVVTRTWFHTGAWFEEGTLAEAYSREYYADEESAALLPPPSIADFSALTPQEVREAHRAMKGQMLRQEVWDGDGSPAAPYVVTQRQIVIVPIQPATDGAFACFRVNEFGSHSAAYDGQTDDPRVTQSLVLDVDAYGTPLLSAQVAFGRRSSGNFASIALDEQEETHVVYSAQEVVHDDQAVDRLRLAVPIRRRAFRLMAPPAPGVSERYTAEELLAEWTSGSKTPYGAASPGDLSQLAEQFVRYVDEGTLGGTQAPLTEGEAGPHALVHQTLTLALTDEVLATLDGPAGWATAEDRRDTLEDEGGYLVGEVVETSGLLVGFDGDGDDAWAGSPITTYATASSFLRPEAQTDPFGLATTTLTWDTHSLAIEEAEVEFGALLPHGVSASIDPQTRQPWQVIDLNGVIREVRFDALGRVVKTRLVGDDPNAPRDSWDQPTTQVDYSFASYDAPTETWSPGYAHSYARKEHGDVDTSTLAVDTDNPSYQQSRTYFDGLGREILTKAQAAPDTASPSTPRFLGTGRVVLNNKEKPVKQYEPFFSDSWDFETDAAMTGVTPLLHYDPIGRVVLVDQPDGTQLVTEQRPWRTRTWDAADSLPPGGSGNAWYDAAADADPWELPDGPALETAERAQIEDAIDAAKDASLAHRDTPTIRHLDSLARPFLEQKAMVDDTDAGGSHTVTTDVRVTYDLLGRAVAVDAEYRVDDGASGLETHAQSATETVFDLLGRPLRSVGRDEQTHGQTATTGTRHALPAQDGHVVRSWDSRGNSFRHTFDGLRQPVSTYIDEGAGEYLHTHVVYGADFDITGETAQEHRLLGRPWKLFDASGELRTVEVDDDGNVTEQRKWFVAGYRTLPDWSGILDGTTPLPAYVKDPRATSDPEVFVMLAAFDALGRPKTETLYRGDRDDEASMRSYTYDAGGKLFSVSAGAAGQSEGDVVRSITYNARGQRLVVEKGTKTGTSDTPSLVTTHLYDPNTFRLLRLYTIRDLPAGTDVLQDLRYVYDAVGNVTLRVDGAQDPVYFANAAVTAEQTYAYDALDRLVDARGREHTGTFEEAEGGFGVRRQRNVPYGRGPHAHPNDGTALRRYTQVFSYDAVGNLAEVVHRQGNLGTVLSRRTYHYIEATGATVEAASAEPFQPLFNNQLAATIVGSTTYGLTYDAHGNMDLPHLVAQSWSPLDRLHSIQATAAWASDGDSPTPLDPTAQHDWFYVYAADGQRARKVRAVGTSGATRSQERFYLGSFEVWREYDTNATETTAGVPETERETWHVHDDTGRMAMVETKTWSAGSVVSSPVPRWRLQIDDHLGTATGEVTEAGAIISYEEFHPYGTTAFQAVDGSIDVSRKRYRYTGMERDDETGLHYHHHRHYAPWLGRWTSADPAGLVDGVNRWQYGRAGPIAGRDPTGTGVVGDAIAKKEVLADSQSIPPAPAQADEVPDPVWTGENWYLGTAVALPGTSQAAAVGDLLRIRYGFNESTSRFLAVGMGMGKDPVSEMQGLAVLVSDERHQQLKEYASADKLATILGWAGVGAGVAGGLRLAGAGAVALFGAEVGGAIVSTGNAVLFLGALGSAPEMLRGLAGLVDGQFSAEDAMLLGTLVGAAVGGGVLRYRPNDRPIPSRRPQDVKVNPQPPSARPAGKIGTSPEQEAALRDALAGLRKLGAEDVRVNQQQVVGGERVGINRPDLQFTFGGLRFYYEWDRISSARGAMHEARILANDPKGIVLLITRGL